MIVELGRISNETMLVLKICIFKYLPRYSAIAELVTSPEERPSGMLDVLNARGAVA